MSNYCKECFERQEKNDRLEQDFKREQNRRIELEDYFMKLEKENKELREVKDGMQIVISNYIEHTTKYRQALEKIRDILCNGRTFYEGYFDNPNLSRTDKAIRVIDEVLNDRD